VRPEGLGNLYVQEFSLHIFQTGCGAHPASCAVAACPRGLAKGSVIFFFLCNISQRERILYWVLLIWNSGITYRYASWVSGVSHAKGKGPLNVHCVAEE
jgi:hypothetical protein